MTAGIFLADGNPGPVNEGERLVLQELAARLPDGFELHPNLQVAVDNSGMVEIDVVVFGPDCMWLIEVKDFAGDVRITEHACSVNGEPRSHPVSSTRLKAQKVKSRLSVNPQLSGVWIQPLVVLARKPKHLDLADNMRAHVVNIDRAVQVLSDPSLIGLERNRLPTATRNLAKARLAVDASARLPRSRFGEYEAVEILASAGPVTWWRGRHHLMGNETLLEVHHHNPLSDGTAEQSRLRAVEVGQRLGAHPNLLSPLTAFIGDDGSLVVVHPLSPNPTLESIDVATLDDEAKRRVVLGVASLLAHCKRAGVAHRTLGPANIHVGSRGETRVAGFGTARVESSNRGTVSPADWGIYGDFWAAPEHNGGEVGHEADLYALGKLIGHLWPETPPAALGDAAERLTVASPAQRGPTAHDVIRLARADAPAPPAPASGGKVADRYVLNRELGQGAFAHVWEATDSLTGDLIALKIYESADAGDQVQREYRALEGLNHPAVVRVRDVTRVDGKWALVSEMLNGPDLRAYLLDQGLLSVDTSIAIAIRLLSGLQAIHPDIESIGELASSAEMNTAKAERLAELQADGIIHRDIKPENVIVVEDRGPVLVDFGLAAAAGGGVSGGTLAYRPPDVIGEGSDPDVDLFAVGVVLHEMLTGQHPYENRDPLVGEFTPDDSLTGAIGELVRKACAPKRAERFRSASEFIGALGALGIDDIEIEMPSLAIVDRMEAIKDAMRERRWDDALALCEADWVPIRERIERRRDLALTAEDESPIFEAHGFSLTPVSTSRFELEVDPSGEEQGPGDLITYLVRGPQGELVELLQYRADGGAVWVCGGETFETPMPLQRIGRALRLGGQEVDDGIMFELRMAKITNDNGWSNLYQVKLPELEERSGVEVATVLAQFGATATGTRADVIGDTSNRRNTLCTVGPGDAEHLAAVAHFITRALPLGLLAGFQASDPTKESL